MKRIAIVGAGISGLSVAEALMFRLKADPTSGLKGDAASTRFDGEREVELVVLERHDRPGGNIRTEVLDGYVCEWGPNGFLDSAPETLALIRRVGLDARLLPSRDAARRRFVFRHGRLHQVPGSPFEFARTSLLSWPAKLRVLMEPFARARPRWADESVHAFASRRIGREAADAMIDPMVSGIFAGDARELSLQACFPKMWRMETEHGCLVRALLVSWREKRRRDRAASRTPPRSPVDALGSPAGRLTSFVGGMRDLVHGLSAVLANRIRTSASVADVRKRPEGPGFLVELENGERLEADVVVLTGPSSESARLVRSLDGTLSTLLGEIPSAPLVAVCLGYDAASVAARRGPLDGFGFLVPRGEGPRVLGVLWDSSIYSGRAPSGRVLMRAMLGGARDPQAVGLTDQQILGIVQHDLVQTMRLDREPEFVKIIRHPGGIPQYTVGHLGRLARIDDRLTLHPGLFLAGNSYRGVAINSCIAEAGPLADRVLSSAAASDLCCVLARRPVTA